MTQSFDINKAIEELRKMATLGGFGCEFVKLRHAEAIVTRQQAEIDELRQQLDAQSELVKIAEELRELLAGSSLSICRNGEFSDSLMIEDVAAAWLCVILKQLRDTKGGA
jgi:hypothetical protein